jgi:hypothetical protein
MINTVNYFVLFVLFSLNGQFTTKDLFVTVPGFIGSGRLKRNWSMRSVDEGVSGIP